MQIQFFNSTTIDQLPTEVVSLLKTLDIYYQPAFLYCDATMQNGTYEIAVCISEDEYWIYPYIILPIADTPYCDITSPYGYAGPVASSRLFAQQSEELFLEEIQNRGNIVTEFVRYHYLYNEELMFESQIKNLLNRKVVLLETLDQEEIWAKQFSSTNRNLVRKLKKEEFTWSVKEFEEADVNAFDSAYRANMLHTHATDFYFFDRAFYLQLIEQLGNQLLIAKVAKEGIVYASALFFVSGGIVTYYLSARNLEYPKVPGSNLLLSKMGFWAQENGYKILNFGGGLSLAEDDYLFKFKRNFGQKIADFTIGKRIHQPEIYDQLVQNYSEKNGVEAYEKVKHLLQFYR